MSQSQDKSVRFRCEHCLTHLAAPVRQIGSKRRCPRCQTVFEVPTLKEAARRGVKKGGYDVDNATTARTADPEYVKVTCSLCATVMRATVDQIGQEISCPDCETANLVPESARKPKRKAATPAHAEGYGVTATGAALPSSSEKSGDPKGSDSKGSDSKGSDSKGSDSKDSDSKDNVSKKSDQFVPIHCRLCGTLTQVPRRSIGQTHKCLDCGESIVVTLDDIDRQIKKNAPSKTTRSDEAYVAHQPTEEAEARREVAIKASAAGQVIKVRCPDCDMPIYAKKEDLGHEISCRECTCSFVLPKREELSEDHEPQTAVGSGRDKNPHAVLPDDADDYGVSDVGKPDVYEPLMRKTRLKGDGSELSHSVNHARVEAGSIPDRPLISGVFQFPFYLESLQRWFGLTALALAPAAMFYLVFNMAGFGVIFILGIAMLTLAAWGITVAITMLTIVIETSYGNDRVTDWPGWMFQEWIGETFYLLVAIALSGVPAGMIALVASFVFLPDGLVFAMGMFVFFPFIQLSLLETSSPVDPFSRPIWRSLSVSRKSWILFYSLSAGLAVLTVGPLVLVDLLLRLPTLSPALHTVLLLGLMVPVGIGVSMIYFRLLGRLAWVCSHEALSEEDVVVEEE